MSDNNNTPNAAIYAWCGVGALLSVFVWTQLLNGNPVSFFGLIVWQCIHMYVIGRKDITLRNFDSIDLIAGCFALYFFFSNPIAYVLSAPLIYLATRKPSKKVT